MKHFQHNVLSRLLQLGWMENYFEVQRLFALKYIKASIKEEPQSLNGILKLFKR